MIDVDYNRSTHHQRNLYTPKWERIHATLGYSSDNDREIDKPIVLDEMLKCAMTLAQGIPHVRVDFYVIHETLFFGELTFYHGRGYEVTHPKEFGKQMGDWLVLPNKEKLS